MSNDISNLDVSYEVVTSNESETNMDSLRHDALAWMESIIGTCKSEYQCEFYAKQYARIYNKVTA